MSWGGEAARPPFSGAHAAPVGPPAGPGAPISARAEIRRVEPDGKHLAIDGVPFRVRGVSYGTFRPRRDGGRFPEAERIETDLAAMAAAGFNTVRTYEVPPPEMLQLAGEYGLRLLVGTHYDDWRMARVPGRATRRRVLEAGRRSVDAVMSRCADHPSVLAVSVGNEVPADVVRVHGIGAVEEVLAALVAQVHVADPDMLATYSNFPTTEFLEVEGQDLACFNVFLERPESFRAYLQRLQVVSGDIPLLITELGLASEIHGERAQAEALGWQLRTVDEVGCAGAVVFSWTDEWAVRGEPVTGWGFGITDESRAPKPALDAVATWCRWSLQDLRTSWPSISVVVCAYNEERVISECLRSLAVSDYPELEVLICDDGSSDRTLEIAREFPFRVLALDHGGLSAARNAGIAAAHGDFVAFLDADASCHPEWPYHLALALEEDGVVGTGGPNLPCPDVGLVERAVGCSPGSPTHVLVQDDRAEHVPGCNMAFRKTALEEVDGFETRFVTAGDDVDLCWRLLDRGGEISFSAAAQVRHHRRSTVRSYLRQQRGYGRAERMVSGRHPDRYERLGRPRWNGFIYERRLGLLANLLRPVVYHGTYGMAPFQGIMDRPAERLRDSCSALLPLAPAVALVGLLFAGWARAWLILPAATVAAVLLYAMAVAVAMPVPRDERTRIRLRLLVGLFHVAQPLWRTYGRLRGRPLESLETDVSWTGKRDDWLSGVRADLARRNCTVRGGAGQDNWDLYTTIGPLLTGRIVTAVAWDWFPQYRVGVRPRGWLVLAAVLAITPVLAFGLVGLSAPAVLAAAVATEHWSLRRAIRAALHRSMPTGSAS